MSNIKYEDDIERVKTPILKLFMILLYVISLILAAVAFRDFIISVIVGIGGETDYRWGAASLVCIIGAIFCILAANGIRLLKKGTPIFIYLGLIIIGIALVLYEINQPTLPMFRDIGAGLIVAVIICLILGILSVLKNKKLFTN